MRRALQLQSCEALPPEGPRARGGGDLGFHETSSKYDLREARALEHAIDVGREDEVVVLLRAHQSSEDAIPIVRLRLRTAAAPKHEAGQGPTPTCTTARSPRTSTKSYQHRCLGPSRPYPLAQTGPQAAAAARGPPVSQGSSSSTQHRQPEAALAVIAVPAGSPLFLPLPPPALLMPLLLPLLRCCGSAQATQPQPRSSSRAAPAASPAAQQQNSSRAAATQHQQHRLQVLYCRCTAARLLLRHHRRNDLHEHRQVCRDWPAPAPAPAATAGASVSRQSSHEDERPFFLRPETPNKNGLRRALHRISFHTRPHPHALSTQPDTSLCPTPRRCLQTPEPSTPPHTSPPPHHPTPLYTGRTLQRAKPSTSR